MSLKYVMAVILVTVPAFGIAARWHWRHHIDAYRLLSSERLPAHNERPVIRAQHLAVDTFQIQCISISIPKDSLLSVDVDPETDIAVLSLADWSFMISPPVQASYPRAARRRYDILRSDGSELHLFSRPSDAEDLVDRLRIKKGVLAEFTDFSYVAKEGSERLLEISDRYFQISVECLRDNRANIITGMPDGRTIIDSDMPFIENMMATLHVQCECATDLKSEVLSLKTAFPDARISVDAEDLPRDSR